MKIVAFVPIKLNNERTPGKNIKQFYDGTPLIQCILRTLVKIKEIDELYVFCSDEKIEDYLIEGVKFIKRPAYLDERDATPQDIIREFMKLVDADIYVVSHATSPFVSVEHFEECIRAVVSQGYDSSFTGEKIQKLLWTNNNKPYNFEPTNIPRTQDLDAIYAEVSAAYVFTKETFLTLNRRIGLNPYITEVTGVECVDIDYPEDFEIANAIYKEIVSKGGENNETC